MRIDVGELRKGLAETRKYLLAHHRPSEYHRCYSPHVAGRRVHICARCLGIYPGIVAGLFAYAFLPDGYSSVLWVALLPLPALLDWTVTTFSGTEGFNPVRTATGALLGYGYALGVSLLVFEFNVSVLGIGISYAVVAGVLLSRSW